ncbi:MAG: hypothetical protein RLZZ301_1609 [Bacteroidota bacterium]|jgi:hypothetical protein
MVYPDKILIGRRELADLPDFGLQHVQVKVDTGAYTSSIHVSKCEELDGKLRVIFLDDQHPGFSAKEMVFERFRKKKVKSSTGQVQERYFVFGQICLADLCFKTEFSLTVRKGMRFPILLGRKVLNKRFLVDTSRKYIHTPKDSPL